MTAPVNQTIHGRRLGTVPFVAGGRQTIELDRDGILQRLLLDLSYVVTNGATDPAGALFQWQARLIRRIEVVAGGRDTVWSISGEELAARLAYENQGSTVGMSTAITSGNGATTAVRVLLPLDFTLPNGRRPDDTGLDTRGLGQLSLSITWASGASDLFGTPNSATIGTVVLNVEGDYLLNVPQGAVYLVRAVDSVNRDVTGNNNAFDIILDRGTGLVYRTFMITTTNDNVGVNTVLDNGTIRLESGSYIFRNTSGWIARQRVVKEMYLPSLITGVYFMDILFDGQLVNGINTGTLDSDLKFILDVTKASGLTTVRVNREAVRPLKLG